MKRLFQDITAFFKSHWPHILIAIPGAIAFTALHELAHCVAVWIQGGEVTGFAWIPSGSEWGHMQYSFPQGVEYNAAAIFLSPYAFWISFCLLAGVLSLRRERWPFWLASTVFVWLFIVPLADIANTAAPYLVLNAQNDFQGAFGPTQPAFTWVAIAFGAVMTVYGFRLLKRLYRDRAMGLPAYGVLVSTATALILILTSI